MRLSSRRFFRQAGIAWTVVLAFGLVAPVLLTVAGAFSNAEWYGQRSEGAEAAGTAAAGLAAWRAVVGTALPA